MIAPVGHNEVDPGVPEDVPGEFPEILARFHHGRFYLDHIHPFYRIALHRPNVIPLPSPITRTSSAL